MLWRHLLRWAERREASSAAFDYCQRWRQKDVLVAATVGETRQTNPEMAAALVRVRVQTLLAVRARQRTQSRRRRRRRRRQSPPPLVMPTTRQEVVAAAVADASSAARFVMLVP